MTIGRLLCWLLGHTTPPRFKWAPELSRAWMECRRCGEPL